MRPRVQGTEHEYTLFSRKMGSQGFDPHVLALELLRESDLHLAGEFITNGSRCYFDVGHFEVSTAETTNYYDLILWEKAGEKILDWLRKVMEEKYVGEGTKIHAFKNNTSPDGTSYGSHENYCVARSMPFPAQYVRELVPHFTTRIIYTGAGDLIDGNYVLSPCAYLTSTVVRRLHVIVGDALMNETAIMLRHFTTQAILTLMEIGKLDDVPKLAKPVDDMWHNVVTRNPEKWEVHLDGGEVVSPIDIQRYFLEKAEGLVETERERFAFKTWEQVLDGLERRKSKDLARKIEWLDRYYAIQEAREEQGGTDVEMMACKQYSEIGAERSLFYRRQRAGLIDRVVTDEEILRAIREPPKDTRAFLRRKLSDRFNIDKIDWSLVVVDDDGRRRIDLPDPYATEMETLHG